MRSVAAAAAGALPVTCAFAALLLAHAGLAAADATLQPPGWTPVAPAWGTCPSECRCRFEIREVSCRYAGMERVPAAMLIATTPGLRRLELTGNNITHVAETDLQGLDTLEELVLADNALENMHPLALAHAPHLKRLSLQNCGLTEVPWEALRSAPSLTTLILSGNALSSLHTAAVTEPILPGLLVLVLRKNRLRSIEAGSFTNLTSIRALELDDNLLTEIPAAITDLPILQQLSLSNNRIRSIPSGLLQKCPQLALLELRGNHLAAVHSDAFASLPHLRRLIVSDARELSEFPNLNGTAALEILRLDRAALHDVPSSLCTLCPRLKSLDLKSNQLTRIPELSGCTELRLLELSGNQISTLEGQPFANQGRLHDLLLSHNKIPRVPADAFIGLVKLQVLDLESNEIEDIHPDAFTHFNQLEDLNLGNNIFPHLPEKGLNRLLHLKTFNNPALREIPGPQHFPRVLTLALSYAYHCCAFLPLVQPTKEDEDEPNGGRVKIHDTVLFPDVGANLDLSLWNTTSLVDIWPQLQNLSQKFGPHINELFDRFGADFTYPSNINLPSYMEDYFEEQERGGGSGSDQLRAFSGRVQCLPLPGPFLPCQDLFDWWTLRCGVWIVFLLAMLGNGTVVFVLVFSRSKMDVPRFLVCNLAMADFFMGIYLGFLAVVDASTLGEFRMYAIPWQMSAGCQLAGFLGVLSCELSVYTLAVITLERNYAITHAMHLNKRLSLKHAGYIMAAGWAFSLAMAVLPLVGGISDYRKFAVCLPFETKGAASLAYVVFLMFINGVAFLILMGCYLKMYCAIRGSQAWNSNDSRIAKRMALLVFTDFLCWSPIAFFSLTAAFGLQLVSLEQAKVFTVFVLPLNSCCNPFLYAILTKQFKKDCVLICKAIEESRVTRGIGRCRHSSNFSNRQTPANTNSLVDRSSREHGAPCACNTGNKATPAGKLLPQNPRSRLSTPVAGARGGTGRGARHWFLGKVSWLLCHREAPRGRSDQYAYQIAEIQQKQHKRASSVSSENFSSSRSDSWRAAHHHCGIPLRLLDPKRRSSWAVTRKTSQDSNLSSSRNDSSATSASTSTWRMSRSSASGSEACGVPAVTRPLLAGVAPPALHLPHGTMSPPVVPVVLPPPLAPLPVRTKPRLTRQSAVVQADCNSDTESPTPGNRGLMVRFLATIPSAAETSEMAQESGDSDSSAPGSPVVVPSQQPQTSSDPHTQSPC